MRTSIRLKDLAFMAGVSVSTAPKALKNRRDVSLITKNKIKDLAIAYDYIPNNAALSLQSRKTNTIAVIVPEINNLVYCNMLHYIQEFAYNKGSKVLIEQYSSYKDGEITCVDRLKDGCVDGIVIIMTPKDNHQFMYISIPVVVRNIDKLSLSIQECKSIGVELIKEIFKKIDAKKKIIHNKKQTK